MSSMKFDNEPDWAGVQQANAAQRRRIQLRLMTMRQLVTRYRDLHREHGVKLPAQQPTDRADLITAIMDMEGKTLG